MKALILTGPEQLEWQDLPVPRPKPSQVLIHHQFTAVSTGSEVVRYYNGAGPAIGYMGAGIVTEVGEGVTHLQPGDRVRAGGPHHEYVVVDAQSALKLPDSVDFAQAAYAYLPTLGLHALRLCDYRLGEHACFVGQGVVGLMSSAMAEAMGMHVIALDVEESRLAISRQLGISHPLNPSAEGFADQLRAIVGDKGVDVAVDATGSYHGLVQALQIARRWGRIAILGMYRSGPPDPAMAALLHQTYLQNLHSKELRLVGCSNDPAEEYPAHIWRFSIHDNTRLSLELLGQGKYDLAPAITHRLDPQEGLTLYPRLKARAAGMLGVVYDWRPYSSP